MQNPTHQKDHATKVDHGKQHGSKKNSWHQSMFRGVCNGLMELTDWRNFDGKLTESNPSRHTSRQPKSIDVTFSHPCAHHFLAHGKTVSFRWKFGNVGSPWLESIDLWKGWTKSRSMKGLNRKSIDEKRKIGRWERSIDSSPRTEGVVLYSLV